jgi:peptidoglycan/LPS O-acetylase OafA/YrhL
MRTPSAGGPGAEVTQAGEVRSARIESLRAIAALGVLLGHEFVVAKGLRLDNYLDRILMGGGFGVDLFFALTGYLLFWPFAREHLGGGTTVDLKRYALNRVLRILPLYYAVVIFLLIVQEGGGSFGQWWRFLTFSESFSHATLLQVDGVVWSLVVELHFYVLLPFLAWGIGKLARGSVGRAAVVVLVLGGLSFALFAIKVGFGTPRDEILAYSFPARFFFFVPGMLVALLRLRPAAESPARRPGSPDRAAAASSGCRLPPADAWLLAAAVLWLVVFWDYEWASLAVVPCFLMVGATVLPLRPGPLVRALEWRPLALVGVASYSLYMWHVPILDWLNEFEALRGSFGAQLLIGTPLCLAVAFLSYRVIEAPFLRLRRRWERPREAPPPGGEAPPARPEQAVA